MLCSLPEWQEQHCSTMMFLLWSQLNMTWNLWNWRQINLLSKLWVSISETEKVTNTLPKNLSLNDPTIMWNPSWQSKYPTYTISSWPQKPFEPGQCCVRTSPALLNWKFMPYCYYSFLWFPCPAPSQQIFLKIWASTKHPVQIFRDHVFHLFIAFPQTQVDMIVIHLEPKSHDRCACIVFFFNSFFLEKQPIPLSMKIHVFSVWLKSSSQVCPSGISVFFTTRIKHVLMYIVLKPSTYSNEQ